MSYSYSGLGYDFTIGTPIGDQTISIPIEKLAEDAGMMAVKAGMPIALDELNKALPDLLKKATDIARPIVRAEIDRALTKASTAGTKITNTASQRAGMMAGALILAVTVAGIYIARRKT